MKPLTDDIKNTSTWITTTPTQVTQRFPFYITEAGHFHTTSDYSVSRDIHDSFLFLYTCRGEGIITTDNTTFPLPAETAVIIDCHKPHKYTTASDEWDFLWVHFNGVGVYGIYDILYPGKTVRPAHISDANELTKLFALLTEQMKQNDIACGITTSSALHQLMNTVCNAILSQNELTVNKHTSGTINQVISFIENNYSRQITIDDMVNTIHISKYHFIRRFKRTTGITPYHYLTNHRITVAKTLLRTTDMTIAEIAENCGFSDTSNFISQFKKQTGQKPLGYRHDFT